MISKHAHRGNLDDGHFAGERAGFVRHTVVGQIAAEYEDVGALVDLAEERLQRTCWRVPSVMQIANRGDADDIRSCAHSPPG
jgi:hypothetical protein